MIGTGESCVAPNDGKRKDLIIIAVGRSRYSRQPDTEARSGERATKEDMRSESTAPDSVVKQQPSEHRRSESDQGRKDEPQEAATEGPIGDCCEYIGCCWSYAEVCCSYVMMCMSVCDGC